MTRPLARDARGDWGFSLIELIVSMAIFALFILMIDVVFIGTHRSSRKADLAADVQENARTAVERLSREIRESRVSVVSTSGDGTRVVFKSARLLGSSPEVFCLYVRTTTEPLYNLPCFTNLPVSERPPYTFPVSGCPPPTVGSACALGTYTPLWQYWVAYWLDGSQQLHRATGTLNDPDAAPPDVTNAALWTCPGSTCGEVISSYVNTFNAAIDVPNRSITATLDAQGTRIVQGTAVPTQEILLNGRVLLRN